MKPQFPASLDARNKVVSFRLSDSEYELASDFCKATGVRGMSMLARSAFLAYLPSPADQIAHRDDPSLLQSELKALHVELARMIASLGKIREHIAPEQSAVKLASVGENVY